jgi:hypothetical protein
MKKIVKLTESDLVKIVKKILVEQTSGVYSVEKVFELPGKTIPEISKMIKNNQVVRSGSRIVSENDNQLVYSTSFRIDNPQIKAAGMAIAVGVCFKGTMKYDLTFLIKEGKVKIIADNFEPTNLTKIIPGTSSPCQSVFNFGVITKDQPSSGSDKWSGRTNVWNRNVAIINAYIPTHLDNINSGFSQVPGGTDPFDF